MKIPSTDEILSMYRTAILMIASVFMLAMGVLGLGYASTYAQIGSYGYAIVYLAAGLVLCGMSVIACKLGYESEG